MKSSSNVSSTVCYLKPRTQNVSKHIADLLGSDVTASEQYGVKCRDGKKRDMWLVSYALVETLFHSEHINLFYVFRSQNGGLADEITKTVANFFRPKISKSGRLKKASEIPQPERIPTESELEKMGIHTRRGSAGFGFILYRIVGSSQGPQESQVGYGTSFALAIENVKKNGHWPKELMVEKSKKEPLADDDLPPWKE